MKLVYEQHQPLLRRPRVGLGSVAAISTTDAWAAGIAAGGRGYLLH